jgi:hypothetical protein
MPKTKKSKKVKETKEEVLEDDEALDESEEDFDDSDEDFSEEENEEDFEEIPVGPKRSRGLFNNPWWKKGLLKGFIAWLIFVVFFYLMDFVGLIEVIDAKRWFFFLVLLLVLGMAYEKYLHYYIKF